MAELTKQALVVDNNQSFPNNNNGQITPSVLRSFNSNMIDSTVNQIVYTADSSSFNNRINAISGAVAPDTGSLLVTASAVGNVMTFTKANASTFNVTVGSVIPTGTVSGSEQITALGFVSSSVTASSLVTASFSGNTLTFTKGDSSTFGVTIPDVSGSTIPAGTISGSEQITALGFVSSSVTGSFATTGSNVFRGDQTIQSDGDKNGIFFISGSQFFVGQNELGRFVISSSNQNRWIELSNDNGYFEVYAQTTNFNNGVNLRGRTEARGIFQQAGYPVEINGTLSASLQAGYAFVGGADGYSKQVPTSSFAGAVPVGTATTGSNNFIGDQTITGSVNISGGEHLYIKRSTAGANQLLRLGATDNENNFAFIVTGSDTNPGQQVWGINIAGATWANSFDARVNFANEVTASAGFNVATGSGGGFSAPLQNGYVWVGNGSDRNTTVPTSSFSGGGSTDTGSLMTTGSVSGNVLTFTKGDASTFTLTVATGSGGGGSTDTGSLLVTASFNTNQITFTKGDASQFNLSGIATTGSNTFTGQQTLNANNNVVSGSITFNGTSQFNNTASLFNSVKLNNSIFNVSNFLQIDVASGSIVLQAPNGASGLSGLSHLSSSGVSSQVNLVFKRDGSNGDTIISGSNNIFSNPGTPTTGYKRYIGGNNNLYLNNANGITSQITQSATTVSGVTPTMNNNIFNGINAFTINQAPNPGTHTYSHNIFSNGTITINALAFTGSLNLPQNYSNGTITINAASASVAEIATGISGSGTVTVGGNGIFGGTITATSPRTLLTSLTQGVNNNVLAQGAINLTNISSSAAVNANGNIGAGGFTYSNAGAAGLGLHTTAGAMSTNIGAMFLVASASAIQASSNISPASMTVTNRVFSGSLGLGAMQFNNNQTQGGGNTYTATGSFGGTLSNITGPVMQANGIFGQSNTLFTNVEGRGNYVDFRSNLIGGTFLILTGSNNNAITGSGGGYFGRFNANDGLRNGTAENILVVGTGTSADNRKTGFLIDSGSNTFVEGSLNVSGSTQFTGSVKIAPTFQLNLPTGSNQQAGTAVLDGGNPGTIVVSNSLVTANSIIMLTKQTLAHPNGYVAVSAKSAGTFTITSNHNGDADTVGYVIWNNS